MATNAIHHWINAFLIDQMIETGERCFIDVVTRVGLKSN